MAVLIPLILLYGRLHLFLCPVCHCEFLLLRCHNLLLLLLDLAVRPLVVVDHNVSGVAGVVRVEI